MDFAKEKASCLISCGDSKGTGFFISANLILTARHILSEQFIDETPISISFPHYDSLEQIISGNLIDHDDALDIALIQVEEPINILESYYQILISPIIPEDKWTAYGFPSTTTGQLSGSYEEGKINRELINHKLVQFDVELACTSFNPAFSYTGYSGSALLNKQQFVVGVILKRLHKGLGAISTKRLEPFLKRNQIAFEIDYEKYDNKPFSRNWFNDHIKRVITLSGPRYSPEVNVELGYDQIFEALGKTANFYHSFAKLYGETRILFDGINLNDETTQFKTNIATVLDPLFKLIIKELELNKLEIFKWNEIAELCHKTNTVIRYILRDLYEKTDLKLSDYDKYKLRNLRDLVSKIEQFSLSTPAKLLNNPNLLITGEAGRGKTHLLCDWAVKRIERSKPTLILLGQHFQNGDPWTQIINQLSLTYSKEEFLEELNSIGEKKNERSLLIIDALNEGSGKTLWKNRIDAFLHDIKPYPWIGLILSIRSPFHKMILGNDLLLSNQLITIEHQGFKGNEFNAVTKYFDFYKIQHYSIPLLDPEFSNPLFLKIFCEGLSYKNHQILPKGWQKFAAVFKLYIEHKNEVISDKLDYDPKLHLINKVLLKFAEYFLTTDSHHISREKAHQICDSIIPTAGWSNSLLQHLISEGLLLESVIFIDDDDWEETLVFGYERFGDYLQAISLMKKFAYNPPHASAVINLEQLAAFISNRNIYTNANIIEAIAILISEKYKKEIFEVFPQEDKHPVIISAFFNSLVWRSYEAIDLNKAFIYVDKLLNGSDSNIYKQLLYAILQVASDPFHPLNGDYLHKYLCDFDTVADRDENWTIVIHDSYSENSVIKSYLVWAFSQNDKRHISDDSLLLTCTVMAWFLASSNRFLRDDTTKALVTVLKDRPTVMLQLLRKFDGVNDYYVLERLYAVAYGSILLNGKAETIVNLAQYIYDNIFKNGTPPPHVLLRDYARNCVEKAISSGLDIDFEPSKLRPPYKAGDIRFPSDSEVLQYKINSDEWSEANRAQIRLYDSVMGWGDFSRYIIGSDRRSNWSIESIAQEESYIQLKKSLKGKAFSTFKQLEVAISSFYKLQKNKVGTVKVTQDESWESILKSADGLIALINKKLQSLLTDDQYQELTTKVIPYLISTNNIKLDRNLRIPTSYLQNFIIKKVFDLGWTAEAFGKFDLTVSNRDGGRNTRKEETIGKKYQWIAYHTLIAHLADNYKFYSDSMDESSYYQGPWQDDLIRDIDPSLLIRQKSYSPSERFKEVFTQDFNILNGMEPIKWLASNEDLPDVAHHIEITDCIGENWLLLEGYLDWNEKPPIDIDKYRVPRKNIWYQIRSYLVKREDEGKVFEWALKQDFMGRWMPESHDNYYYYLRESYWAPSYEYHQKPYYGNEGWTNPSHKSESTINMDAKILVTTEHQIKESGGYDCSIDESISSYIPVSAIAQKMELHFEEREGYLYDRDGNLVSLDPSLFDGGPTGIYINKQKFLDFLDANDFAIVWTVLGEKRILGNQSNYGLMEISGAYHLDDSMILKGNLSYINK